MKPGLARCISSLVTTLQVCSFDICSCNGVDKCISICPANFQLEVLQAEHNHALVMIIAAARSGDTAVIIMMFCVMSRACLLLHEPPPDHIGVGGKCHNHILTSDHVLHCHRYCKRSYYDFKLLLLKAKYHPVIRAVPHGDLPYNMLKPMQMKQLAWMQVPKRATRVSVGSAMLHAARREKGSN